MANEINILWASMSGTAENVAKNLRPKQRLWDLILIY